MAAPALQPIVIWFGRVGDMILLSALLGVLHRRFGGRCYVIGAGSWPAELYAAHADVARVECLRRYTLGPLDANWWRALRQLRARRGAPVYVCEFDVKKLARVRRLLAASGTDPAHCLYLTQTASWQQQHWVDRLVSFGRLTPPALDAAAYPGPAPRRAALRTSRSRRRRRRPATPGWRRRASRGAPLVLLQPGNRRTMRGRRAAPRRRRRSRVAGRALGAAGAAAACAAAGGAHRAVRRTARGVAAAVDHAGGAPAGAARARSCRCRGCWRSAHAPTA